MNTTIPALDDVIVKSLAKAPKDRFHDARSSSEALVSAAIGSITNDHGAEPSAADEDLRVVPAMSSHVGSVIALR